jgi:hypothetical protein
LGDAASTALAVTATAIIAALDGWWYLPLALAAWPLAWLAARRWGGLAAGGWLAMAFCVAVVGAATAMGSSAPWTLLEPGWSEWAVWLPWSLVAGVLAGGAGVDAWRRLPQVPGRPLVPWLFAGLVILTWTALAVRAGALFEQSHTLGPDPLCDLVIALAGLAVISASVGGPRRSAPQDVVGWAAAGLLVLAPGALTAWLYGGLPLVLSLALGSGALRRAGLSRALLFAAAALCAGAALMGWPTSPNSLSDSAVAASLIVVGFWLVATRTTLERQR